jgi:PKD repeat protein
MFAGMADDPDGDPVTVLWDFGDGGSSTDMSPGNHTYVDPGTYIVTFTATDDKGLSDPTPDTRTITVEAENQPPEGIITSPAGDENIAPGESVMFAGMADDPDGDPVTVLWDFGDGGSSTDMSPGNHTYVDPGTYTVTFTATDDKGLSDPTPDTRTIAVEAENQPPDGVITSPAGALTIMAGESVMFAGMADDPDGDPVTVLWDFGDGITSTQMSPGNHTYTDPGTYTVTFTATDDKGLSDPTPDTRTITVEAVAPPAVTLTTLQDSIFTPTCVRCHGGSRPEADMDLSAGQSHGNLVNVAATTQDGVRVIPFQPDNSVLVKFLDDGHRNRPESERLQIRSWIGDGAQDN